MIRTLHLVGDQVGRLKQIFLECVTEDKGMDESLAVRSQSSPAGTGTDYRFTGQRRCGQRQSAWLGLYHVEARWLDRAGPGLSADTLVVARRTRPGGLPSNAA